MTWYFNSKEDDEATQSYITQNEAREVAENFISAVATQEVLQNYKCEGTIKLLSDCYNFLYVKYIEGYATDDTILIAVTESGRVKAYNASECRKYEELEGNITKEALDNAKLILEKQIEESELKNPTIDKTEVTTNSSGDVYLSMEVSYDAAGTRLGIKLYTEVETKIF